ncbi:MAG: choice-of-anchor L domain-containing protein [Ferruginibacter sp.]
MKLIVLFISAFLITGLCNAQLIVTTQNNAQLLAQRLVGEGVSISNVTLSGDSISTGFFHNISGTQIGIDSGIVLTNGRAQTSLTSSYEIGMDGDGVTEANDFSGDAFADNSVNYDAHDSDLALQLNTPADNTHDATVLEFDFIPVGDSIKFRYVFSSEEYPDYACPSGSGTIFNDAFAFLIQGPGFPVKTNIALIPGTTDPVSIHNINDQGCAPYPQYYINNETNVYFTHNGHSVVLTALANVVPCQTYHLKLVIADVGDGAFDSGVFLEAKSLTSNVVQLTNNTQTDNLNNSYIVEGCITGSFTMKRPTAPNYPLSVNLTYSGTAINGVDYQTLPATVTIPANDSMITINVIPIIDNVPEGIEYIKISATSFCGSAVPYDSTVIQIRDYDTLSIVPSNTAFICKNGSIQLHASAAWSTFQWDATAGLNNYSISNPVATPAASGTSYICTANVGSCHGRDSVTLRWRDLEFNSQANVNCHDAATGQIIVSGGPEWTDAPVQYSINNGAPQASGTFNNLVIGDYMAHITDGSGCKDSVPVHVIQAFPDLLITDAAIVAATCTTALDGTITITASGGKPPYRYSINGTTFQSSNVFHVGENTFTISVMDANNCRKDMPGITVPFINALTLSTGVNPVICESKSTVLPATTNGTGVVWSVASPGLISTLNNITALHPTANPVITTKYYVVSTLGVCTLKDSVTVFVNPAPIPDAGADVTICNGGTTQLNGSGAVDYVWHPVTYLSNPNISNPFVTNPATITYNLDITDTNGCKSLRSSQVHVTVLPPAKLFAGYDTAVAINQPLHLYALDINHVGFVQYEWSPSTGLNNPLIWNPTGMLTAANTDLIVTAYTPEHCIGKDTINVKTYKGPEIYVASSFTPNGDGLNDVLRAFPVGIKSFKYFSIYNRYGQLVFSTTDQNRGWDGKFKAALQNLSTFVWIAAGIDYKGNLIERKGTVTIIQ